LRKPGNGTHRECKPHLGYSCKKKLHDACTVLMCICKCHKGEFGYKEAMVGLVMAKNKKMTRQEAEEKVRRDGLA